MNRRSFLKTSTCLVAGLTGCTVGEDFVSPEKEVPEQFFTSRSTRPVARGYERWWTAYDDPKLNRLVEFGLKENLDVRRAQARVEQSKALFEGSGYAWSGVARVGEFRANGGGNEGGVQSGFVRAEATWQADLAGRLTREREATLYRLEAAFADVSVARTTLLSELTTAYIDARFFQELIRINQRVLESREETLAATISARESMRSIERLPENDNGDIPVVAVTELDVAQARSLVANARAELPETKILFFKSVSRIGMLLGQAWDRPKEGLDKEAPQPVPQLNSLSTGVPADLVRNRPDVILAENRLAEAVALAGVAEAELYPELRLTGNINLSYSGGDLAPLAGFGRAGIDIPLFDLPERRAKVAFQKERAKELIFAWEEEVVSAVEEVQDALVSLVNHREAVQFTSQAIEELKEVLRLARQGYIAGRVSFLQVLDAERGLLATENALALDKRNFAVDFVNLNVALGGNYG